MSVAEVQKASAKGAIDGTAASKAILAGMEGQFGGGMEKAAQTIPGVFSTLRDSIGRSLGELAAGLMDAFDLKGWMKSGIAAAEYFRAEVVPPIVNGAKWLQAQLTTAWQSITGGFSAGVSRFQPVIDTFVADWGSRWSDIWSILQTFWTGFVSFADTFAARFTEWFPLIAAFWELSNVVWTTVATLVEQFVATALPLLTGLFDMLMT